MTITNPSRPQRQIRNDPGHPIKTSLGGRSHYGCAVLLYEALQSEIVVVAAIHCSDQFAAHALGVGAADVIAFEQDLVAATDAHHSVAKVVHAGRLVASAKQREHGERQHEQLSAAFQEAARHSEERKRR